MAEYNYLMNMSSALFFICYVPELYANYKNKNANMYNVPEKVLVLIGTFFAFLYAVFINNPTLMWNYGPLLGLDLIAFLMRLYYVLVNRYLHNGARITPEPDTREISVPEINIPVKT